MMEKMMTTAEAANFLGLSPRTLESWRLRGGGPRYHRIGKRVVRYAPDDLRAWSAEHVFEHTTEETARNAA